MTDEQRSVIVEYRKEGLGYKKISRLTGICESTIKTFCHRNGCCGKPIIQYPGRKEKKFCSDSCRNRWWNSHLHLVKRKAMYDFVCPTCGKSFSAYGNRNRKYCSHECYIEARFGGATCG